MGGIESLDDANRPREHARRDTEEHRGQHRERKRGRPELRDHADVVALAGSPERGCHRIAHKRREEAVHAGAILQLAHEAHLHTEESTRKRRAEHPTKRSGNARHEEILVIVFAKLEETRNGIGNRPPNLDRRALSARRTAGKMRGNRAHKGERCHNGRNAPARDSAINHQVISARSVLAVPAIEPRREDANRR